MFGFGKYTYKTVIDDVFERYEEVEVPTYCDCCGQEDGTRMETRGVNKIGEKKRRVRYYDSEKILDKIMEQKTTEFVVRTNFFLGKFEGEPIKIPKIDK